MLLPIVLYYSLECYIAGTSVLISALLSLQYHVNSESDQVHLGKGYDCSNAL